MQRVEVDWVKWLSIQWVGKKRLEDKIITVVQFDEYIKKESLLKYFLRLTILGLFLHNNSFLYVLQV
jgi:hypothetical protein